MRDPRLSNGRGTAESRAPAARPAPEPRPDLDEPPRARIDATPPERKGRRLWWIPLAAVLVLAGLLVRERLSPAGGATFTTAPVTRGPIQRAVIATGTVNPEVTVTVGAYVSGIIQELACDYNTEVKQGQVCAKIDPRPYQTAVDQAQANLDVAKAQLAKDQAALEYARIDLERSERLVARKAVSQDVLDNARSAYAQAGAQIALDEATISQRQAALDSAQVDLDYTDIVSPVDGTVVSRSVTAGQTVAASFQTPTLFLIASDLTRMQVDTNVSESDIGGVQPGDRATFTVDAYPGRTFEGEVAQVRQSPQTVQNVVTYDVVVSVRNEDLALKPGMTASARVITEEREDALRAPNAAVRFRPSDERAPPEGQDEVWMLRGGRPVAIPVETGLDDDTNTEIVSGEVQEGDQVITAEETAASRAAASTSPRPAGQGGPPPFRL